MRASIVAICVLGGALVRPAAVRADADEASIHTGLLIAGTAIDMRGPSPAVLIPAAGLSSKFTYATSDWYAYEAMVELECSTRLATFTESGQVSNPPGEDGDRGESDSFMRRLGWVRGEAGISARMGVRWIPTLYAGLGVQVQLVGQARDLQQGLVLPGSGREVTPDLVAVVGAGLDFRVDEHWVFGGSVRVRHSVPRGQGESYGAIGFAVHVGYYWYPGNIAR